MRRHLAAAFVALFVAFAPHTDAADGIWWPRGPWWAFGAIGPGSPYMDASTERSAYCFLVPADGTLDGVEFHVINWFGFNAPDNGLRVSFQNVDASGNPDGTQDQYKVITVSAAGWQTDGSTNVTSDGTSGGVKRTVTQGDPLCMVIQFESFVAGDIVQLATVTSSENNNTAAFSFNTYPLQYNGSSWTKYRTELPNMALVYTGGAKYPVCTYPCWPMTTAANGGNVDSGDATNDEVGNRFTMPFTGDLKRLWTYLRVSADADIVVYDTNGTTELTSAFIDSSAAAFTGAATIGFVTFPDSPTLASGSTYRWTIRPTSASALTYTESIFPSSALRQIVEGGGDVQKTGRVDAGSWTQTDTRVVQGGMYFDNVQTGGSSSPTAHTFVH